MYRVVYSGSTKEITHHIKEFIHRKKMLDWLSNIKANPSAYEVARWSTVTGLTDIHLQVDCEEYFLKIDQS